MQHNSKFAELMLQVITQCSKQGCTEEEIKLHIQEASKEYDDRMKQAKPVNVPLYSDMMKQKAKDKSG